MFTGLIVQTGVLTGHSCIGGAGKLFVRPGREFDQPEFGESVAVNGVCLTLERYENGILEFHTLEETLKRTNLGKLALGSLVNLERALKVGARVGGHFVSGHVDGTGRVLGLDKEGGDICLKVELPENLRGGYLVEKGSIAVDGVSLTLIEVGEEYFRVGLIPVTLEETALCRRGVGVEVNLESDLLGKYVIGQLRCCNNKSASRVTMDLLSEAGFLGD